MFLNSLPNVLESGMKDCQSFLFISQAPVSSRVLLTACISKQISQCIKASGFRRIFWRNVRCSEMVFCRGSIRKVVSRTPCTGCASNRDVESEGSPLERANLSLVSTIRHWKFCSRIGNKSLHEWQRSNLSQPSMCCTTLQSLLSSILTPLMYVFVC
jgi:hypothetical protein